MGGGLPVHTPEETSADCQADHSHSLTCAKRALSCHTYIGQRITPLCSAPASPQPPSVHKNLQQNHAWSSQGHGVRPLCSASALLLLHSSVGAGCDWLVQLQVQRCPAELQAAVAALAHSAGLKQLLAGHRNLLVTAAGAEHVTAVPAGGFNWVRAALTDGAAPAHHSHPIKPQLESCSSNMTLMSDEVTVVIL